MSETLDTPDTLPALALPAGIRSRRIDGINGLSMHLLEAGFETAGRPTVLLLHGFPELAYSWRKLMPLLAAAGWRVIAPDLRGYGRTTGWDRRFDGDLSAFRFLNLVRDCVGLLAALELESVDLVGHDFGSPLAAWCALLRPDRFRSVVLMSAPFAGPPGLPEALPKPAPGASGGAPGAAELDRQLAGLARPRKHYQWYYSSRQADADMRHCKQGVHDFLRAYYHVKSADWPDNQPFELSSWAASELARMPTYYIMDRHEDMAQTVAAHMPSAQQIAACRWLTDAELQVYSSEYSRTSFQGGLQWYRCGTTGIQQAELQAFAGRRIEVPTAFIAGASDWGIHQKPGDLKRMATQAARDFRGIHLIPGAGHWVQQEQPEAVADRLLAFLRSTR